MEPINQDLLARVDAYIENLFGLSDPVLDAALREAAQAGLPNCSREWRELAASWKSVLSAATAPSASPAPRPTTESWSPSAVLQTLPGEMPFDLIFIDADKTSYPRYLELVLPLSRPGTVMIAHNVIRHGSVLGEASGDADVEAIRIFNHLVAAHPRLDSTILPLRSVAELLA